MREVLPNNKGLLTLFLIILFSISCAIPQKHNVAPKDSKKHYRVSGIGDYKPQYSTSEIPPLKLTHDIPYIIKKGCDFKLYLSNAVVTASGSGNLNLTSLDNSVKIAISGTYKLYEGGSILEVSSKEGNLVYTLSDSTNDLMSVEVIIEGCKVKSNTKQIKIYQE